MWYLTRFKSEFDMTRLLRYRIMFLVIAKFLSTKMRKQLFEKLINQGIKITIINNETLTVSLKSVTTYLKCKKLRLWDSVSWTITLILRKVSFFFWNIRAINLPKEKPVKEFEKVFYVRSWLRWHCDSASDSHSKQTSKNTQKNSEKT